MFAYPYSICLMCVCLLIIVFLYCAFYLSRSGLPTGKHSRISTKGTTTNYHAARSTGTRSPGQNTYRVVLGATTDLGLKALEVLNLGQERQGRLGSCGLEGSCSVSPAGGGEGSGGGFRRLGRGLERTQAVRLVRTSD